MASTRLAPETPHAPFAPEEPDAPFGDGFTGPGADAAQGEWNPTADSLGSVRGRHRVVRQRGGGVARSSAVLGVGMIAAVGAGGIASAKDAPAPVSMPDLAGAVSDHLPQASQLPGIGSLVSDGAPDDGTVSVAADAPLTPAVTTLPGDGPAPQDAGQALAARLLAQASQQQTDAHTSAVRETADAAASKAAEAASQKAEAARKAAAAAAAKKAEAERRAKLAASYTLPVSSFRLTAGFGQGGDLWSADHTGQDFAAPTGTPVKAVHSGTVKSAGWAGAYGYRIVLQLDDGTELWFCHLSSMNVSVGQHVDTKDVIGNVGATGNVTGPHLHLEVRPGGDSPIDPMPWLRDKGLKL